jgi:hypothetical protein
MEKMQNQHAIRFSDADVEGINRLRRAEPDFPTFAEMVRRLVRRAVYVETLREHEVAE